MQFSLRGSGSQRYSQNNGENIGITTTEYSSGSIGAIQGDSGRPLRGWLGHAIYFTDSDQGFLRNGSDTKNLNNPFYVELSNGIASNPTYGWSSTPRIGNRAPWKTSEHPYVNSGFSNDWYEALTKWKYEAEVHYNKDGDITSVTFNETEIHPNIYFDEAAIDLVFDISLSTPVDKEYRPVNTAVRYFIRAR